MKCNYRRYQYGAWDIYHGTVKFRVNMISYIIQQVDAPLSVQKILAPAFGKIKIYERGPFNILA